MAAKAGGLKATALTGGNASGDFSFAVGNNAQAKGWGSVAIGAGTLAENQGTVAIGHGAKAYSLESVALGYNTQAGAPPDSRGRGTMRRPPWAAVRLLPAGLLPHSALNP